MDEHKKPAPPPAPILRLVLGDQLSGYHSWYQETNPQVVYVMMEIKPETSYVTHHVQKLVGVLSAMRLFAARLQNSGHRVGYWRLTDPDNRHSFAGNLAQIIPKVKAQVLEYQTPDEWRLQTLLSQEFPALGIEVREVSTEHFLSGPGDFRLGQRMETFYRGMRKKTGFLMEGSEPWGGIWNYDPENRKLWKGSPLPPPAPNFPLHQSLRDQALKDLDKAGVGRFGNLRTDGWWWPLTAEESRQALENFVRFALPHFGDYQDALAPGQPTLFHSLLSFALNLKILHPREVVSRAVEEYRVAGPEKIPLSSLEGFVRQILGWREFMRRYYQAVMPGFRESNILGAYRPLPDWYWSGQTSMACLSQGIRDSLNNSYAHHISRLMVTGNFALLAGVHPDELDRWYLGVYIDAFEWVEMTNTRGMSQYADGGGVASKPYAASAAYVWRMGGPCKACGYNPSLRYGQGACPLNSLYWGFIDQHQERWKKNPRMAMPLRTWGIFSKEERISIIKQRDYYVKHMNSL